jgi:putative chitinase
VILPSELLACFPTLTSTTAFLWSPPIAAAMAEHSISSKARMAMFLAHVAVETGELRTLRENLSYTSPQIRKLFWRHVSDSEINAFVHQPQYLANRVYANRMGNGSYYTGDGYKYRGGGLLQTTGRDGYRQASLALGVDLEKNPELIEEPWLAARCGAWEWKRRGCNELADAGDIEGSTKAINGGLNGFEARLAAWRRCKTALFGQEISA